MCKVGSLDTSDSGLYYEVNCDNAGLHDLSRDWDLLKCDSVCNCLDLREHEYAWGPDDKSTEIMQVQGHLKRHVVYWVQVLKAPNHIIDLILNGYVLPLFSVPTPYIGCNYKSALGQKDFVTSAVLDLLATGCILKVDKRPFICSSFLV